MVPLFTFARALRSPLLVGETESADFLFQLHTDFVSQKWANPRSLASQLQIHLRASELCSKYVAGIAVELSSRNDEKATSLESEEESVGHVEGEIGFGALTRGVSLGWFPQNPAQAKRICPIIEAMAL